MSRVDELLHRYIAAHRAAGDADPLPYLDEVSGVERAELRALIDRYLAEAPPPPFDPDAFARFAADPARAALVRRILEPAPSLEQLRREAGLAKQTVGERLAAALGLRGHEAGVKAAYHDIETGQVDPRRVRPGVWRTLGDLLGQGVDRVRDAAVESFAPPAGAGPVFARSTDLPLDFDYITESGPVEDPVRDAFFSDEPIE